MNPNNDSFWESRGYDERPDDWEKRAQEEKATEEKEQRIPRK